MMDTRQLSLPLHPSGSWRRIAPLHRILLGSGAIFLLGLLAFGSQTACDSYPVAALLLEPDSTCDPSRSLAETSAYRTGLPPTEERRLADLFAENRRPSRSEAGCLVSRWKNKADPSKPPKLPENDKVFSTVFLAYDGVLTNADPKFFGREPVIRYPKGEEVVELFFRLYLVHPDIFGSSSYGSAEALEKICKEMQEPDYNCLAADQRHRCRLYIDLYARDPDKGLKNLALPPQGGASCRLCLPESCDGVPNSCFCSPDDLDCLTKQEATLTKTCYTGPEKSLLAGSPCKRGLHACKGGRWSTDCLGEVVPKPEECNNEDDDCDGSVDEETCGPGETCSAQEKRCIPAPCRTNLLECDGQCIDPLTNPDHCGKCGKRCPDDEVCGKGSCAIRCPNDTPTICNRGCVDLGKDSNHCGNCTTICPSGYRCEDGKCRVSCPPQTPHVCDQACVDLKANVAHCGVCKNACPEGERCADGKCRASCPNQTPVSCGNACVNTNADANHCGACNLKCGPAELCSQGLCVSSCPDRTPDACQNACVDIKSDPSNCGLCGRKCADGERCVNRTCVISCPPSTPINCNSACVDLKSNPLHCGACGKICKTGERCSAGNCVTSCPASTPDNCNDACVDVKSNPNHCGTCGKICNSGERCFSGTCVISCPSLTPTDCNGACVDLKNNLNHCGACNNACAPGQICFNSVCQVSCPINAPLCGPATNRICCPLSCCSNTCVDLTTDTKNCGTCGKLCPQGEICAGGVCKRECTAGLVICGAGPAALCCKQTNCCNNACVDTQTDPSNCGTCGTRCGLGESCCKGLCVDLQSHPQNCGTCNLACPSGQTCTSARCCATGLVICTDTCVDLETNRSHCGNCGNACQNNKECTQRQCICPGGTTDCQGLCVNTQTDLRNCGGCGLVCPGGRVCTGGRCVCPANFIDCQGGCVNPTNDPANCGGCGLPCRVGLICKASVCACPDATPECLAEPIPDGSVEPPKEALPEERPADLPPDGGVQDNPPD